MSLPLAPIGVPQIEVTFDIDSNGILHVSAKDKATGKSQNIRIGASSGLSESEIQHVKEEAVVNAESDKNERERIDKLNAADALIFQAEKQLKEYGDNLPEGKKAEIETALGQLRTAHASQDVGAVDAAMNQLNSIWQTASEEMYKNTHANDAKQAADAHQQPHNEGPTSKPSDHDVTDVDFEEVNDKK